MYKCGKCKRSVELDANTIGLRCPYCGSKVFYKERPTLAKQLKAK